MRIGIIGGGAYGSRMLSCFAGQQRRGRIDLVAIADIDATVRTQQAEVYGLEAFSDYRQMLERELDAVIVATPDHLHADPIADAIAHGLHVLTQKPLDTDLARAEANVRAAESAGVLLYVDFHKRFDPAHMALRDDILAGRLGDLHYAYAHMEDRMSVPLQWRDGWASASSPAWFLGVHFFDLFDWLTGLAPRRVLASGHKGQLEAAGLTGAWDSVQARVAYDTGFSVSYDMSWVLPESFPSVVNQGLRLVGGKGIVEIDSQDRGYQAAFAGDGCSTVANPFSAFEQDHPVFGRSPAGYVYDSMVYFIDMLEALKAGKTLVDLKGHYPDGRSALVATRIGAAIERSLESGAPEAV